MTIRVYLQNTLSLYKTVNLKWEIDTTRLGILLFESIIILLVLAILFVAELGLVCGTIILLILFQLLSGLHFGRNRSVNVVVRLILLKSLTFVLFVFMVLLTLLG